MSNLAKKIINEMSEEDQQTLRSWADEAYVIRNDENLTKSEKITKISTITNKNKITLKFFKSFFKLVKRHTWDERGWSARLALAGLTIGAAVAGTKMAGIATAGVGIGVPIYVLSSAGGALLGTIIQEVKKD
jgi:hypothetical protein